MTKPKGIRQKDKKSTSKRDEVQHLKDQFSKLMSHALKDGLIEIEAYVKSESYVRSYTSYPSLSYKSNGLPNLSNPLLSGPKDYRGCFKGSNDKGICDSDIQSFNDVVGFVRANPILLDLILPNFLKANPKVDELKIGFDKIYIVSLIQNVLELYIHIEKKFEYDEALGDAAINKVLAPIFDATLSIDICIPILFLKFQCDVYEISEGVAIEKISDDLHLCRYGSFHINSNQHVKAAATHQLVLKNWQAKNNRESVDFLSKPSSYPLEIINKFFAVIQMIVAHPTGYAQIYSLANGWTGHVTAHLPYVVDATVRSYPSLFDNYYWNIEAVPTLTSEELYEIKKYYNLAASATENSLRLSLNRLNKCLLRDSEEDGVIDATIALEALLTDDGTTEMTHKLALRVGALCKLDPSFEKTPQEAFKEIKSVYSYRSAIVHGSTAVDKKRILKTEGKGDISTHSMAIDYLKMVMKILLENPVYREARNIDNILLLGRE